MLAGEKELLELIAQHVPDCHRIAIRRRFTCTSKTAAAGQQVRRLLVDDRGPQCGEIRWAVHVPFESLGPGYVELPRSATVVDCIREASRLNLRW